MSRTEPFTGARLALERPTLWVYQSKILNFTASIQRRQLYPSTSGPIYAEWFMIEADINNDDIVAIGEKDVNVFATVSPPSTQCITTLAPGEAVIFEPDEEDAKYDGIITAPDGDTVQLALTQPQDLVDVTQFYGMSGVLTAAGVSLHMTIGSRTRT